MRQRKKERQEDAERLKKVESEKNMKEVEANGEKANEVVEKVWDPNDPMQRAPYFFGGMINDVKRRAPHFLRYKCYITVREGHSFLNKCSPMR